MAIQDEMRTDLEVEVFNEIGKSVTLITQDTKTYNSRGELENTTTTSTAITVVPYNITESRESQQRFGDLQEGDLEIAIPYTVTVAIGNLIVMEGITYEIKEIIPNYLPGNVVTIALISKTEDFIAND